MGNTCHALNVRATAEPGSRSRRPRHPRALAGIALAALLSLANCSSSVQVGPGAIAGLTPDGTVDMQQVQAAYLVSGGGGNGTLYYRGSAYPFNIGGVGIVGIGASTI